MFMYFKYVRLLWLALFGYAMWEWFNTDSSVFTVQSIGSLVFFTFSFVMIVGGFKDPVNVNFWKVMFFGLGAAALYVYFFIASQATVDLAQLVALTVTPVALIVFDEEWLVAVLRLWSRLSAKLPKWRSRKAVAHDTVNILRTNLTLQELEDMTDNSLETLDV